MSLPRVLESCTVNEHNPLSCLPQWREGATAICQIKLLCKTTTNMWTGLSAWLAHHLRVKIEMRLLHLLRDTKEFVDDFRHLQWQDGMRMVKIDITEFYTSGKPGSLSHACSELFCDETEEFQQLVAKAVDWPLQKSMCAVGILALPDLQSYERVRHGSASQW